MRLMIFVSHEIRLKMCASRTPAEWDETFELFVDMTLGYMALNMGQRYLNRIERLPMHTSIRTGHQYMLELLNQHPDRMFNKIRMYRPCFEMLIQVLRQQTTLQNSRYLTLEEQVMIFVYVISQKATNRMAMEDWQHSGSTISVVFTRICKAIASLSQTFIKPPNFDAIPDEIQWNPKYYPYFQYPYLVILIDLLWQNCIGAIDGTHIAAHAPADVANNFRGRKSTVTSNMLAICSFDMLFTYVVTGWEGAIHDSRVLTTQLEDPTSGFPHPPPGKYYLVDSGYSNKPGFLAPFSNVPYHLRDTRRRAGGINGPTELFNYRHASLRNCIERCFGVLKARFPILRYMTNFSLIRQREIAMCCFVLHNFIRLHNRGDPLFDRYGVDGVMPPSDSDSDDDAPSSSGTARDQGANSRNDNNFANDMRDRIMLEMYLNYN
ncbi:hypothetical protein UlMin_041676 [Ulmus minor]